MTFTSLIKPEAFAMREQLVALRRDLHMHPELAFNEYRTAGVVAQKLAELGYEVQTGIAKTGVVGLMESAAQTPSSEVLLLRFDMDALPVKELTAAPYASQNEGVMHACGHDAHVAIGLGVAELLAKHRDQWRGAVKFVFQPAEEIAGGAKAMIDDGVNATMPPTRGLSVHVLSLAPVGTVNIADGPVMGGGDKFEVTVRGRGTHTAEPQNGASPILAAAAMIQAISGIAGANIAPQDPCALAVGYIHGGNAANVVPDEVVFGGTMRAYDKGVVQAMRKRIGEIVDAFAKGMNVEAALAPGLGPNSPVVNDPAQAELVRQNAAAIIGAENVKQDYRWMAGEDVWRLYEGVPGVFAFVGAGNVSRGFDKPHHNPRFDIDEDCLPIGVATLAASAMEILK
jgi:amidohydrolase